MKAGLRIDVYLSYHLTIAQSLEKVNPSPEPSGAAQAVMKMLIFALAYGFGGHPAYDRVRRNIAGNYGSRCNDCALAYCDSL